MYDINRIKSDFPILSRQVYGRPLVYLDNGATSQKPASVIQAIVDYYQETNSNIHRGVHALSMEATDRHEEARTKVARFIGAPSIEETIFVRGTTEGINLVANCWALANIKEGDEILLTEMEHHSNLVPWQRVAQMKGATLRYIPINQEGTLDLTHLDSLLNRRTKLLALTHMSNVLGTINPIKELAFAAHRVGAKVLVDAAQSVPHLPVNVKDLGCDFLAFSGHKMLGPTGIGALYVNRQVLETMEPYMRGGDMVREVWFDRATWNDLPFRFEAGTPNIAGAIGLGAAVDYLENLGMENVRAHEKDITEYALKAFQQLEEVTVFGPSNVDVRGGVVSFHCDDVHPHDMGSMLDRNGIAVRTGHHCAMPLMGRLGVVATTRATFYVYNTLDEVDLLVSGIRKTIQYFKNAIRRT
jgi:cysteine desulfurase/selenocysteine lyase